MRSLSQIALCVGAVLFAATDAQGTLPGELVGTWSTKSNKTLTGPGFYNPQKDEFIEPSRTGFSYSFAADGTYEEAYYRAIANPQNPKCPSGIMQWQHGSWQQNPNGSLSLTPIAVDGRQLMSTPCNGNTGIYTRYNQTELFKTYQVYTDTYHNILRLDLFEFDGTPMNPMYLAYQPPIMLPTSTLNPTTSATGGAKATAKSRKVKRDVPAGWEPKRMTWSKRAMDPDWVWWMGLASTGIGGLLYFGPRRMGIQL